MRFDHLLHFVPDRQAAVASYQRAGFHLVIGGDHVDWGSHNALCHFGLPYVEAIALHDERLAGARPTYNFRNAGGLLARGGGALTFAVAVPNIAETVQELRKRGFDVGQPERGRRVRPDGSQVGWQCAPLLAGPEWRPFLLQWDQGDDERLADLRQRGIDAPHPLGDLQIRRLTIATHQPEADATWAALLTGQPARPEGDAWIVPLPSCELALASPEHAGVRADETPLVATVHLEGHSIHESVLFGLRMAIAPGNISKDHSGAINGQE